MIVYLSTVEASTAFYCLNHVTQSVVQTPVTTLSRGCKVWMVLAAIWTVGNQTSETWRCDLLTMPVTKVEKFDGICGGGDVWSPSEFSVGAGIARW